MKYATSYVKATVQNELLVHEHSIESLSPVINCFVYYTLLEASPRAHQPLPQIWPRPVLACSRLVPSSLPICTNQQD